MSLTSNLTIPEDAITKTKYGDIGIITYKPLIPAEIEASVRSKKAGAVVSFVGYTRDEFQGKEVIQLEYESYIPLAIKTLHSILLEARSQPPPILPSTSHCFDHTHHRSPPSPTSTTTTTTPLIELTHITIHHLLGSSPPLTPSLVICVSSPHRKEAFLICEYLLELIKLKLQIWKKEFYKDGSSFKGKDGQGVEGSRYVWKENFPVDVDVDV